MAMNSVTDNGAAPSDLIAAIKELQRLKFSRVNGAAASTKMNVAALRKEDTIIGVFTTNDAAAGVSQDDTANVTISETRAQGTLTVSGNPVNDETFVVNDVTYTWKTTPTAMTHVKITAGDNNAMAAAVSAAVNSYENRRLSTGNFNIPAVVATVATNVVTFTSVTDGAGNAPNAVGSDADLTVGTNLTASVTVTCAAVDADDTLTLNGIVFTAKATPTADTHFLLNNADNTQQAVNLRRAINTYEAKYGTLDVVATSAAAVVTLVPRTYKKGNIITLTEASTNVAVSGSGTLANGTATGGITSSTNNTNRSVHVIWFDKNP